MENTSNVWRQKHIAHKRLFKTYGRHVSSIKGFFLAEQFSISQCSTHMEVLINASLCLRSLALALALWPPFLSTFGNRVGRGNAGKVFISESSSTQLHDMFFSPPEGTLMILSLNGICLRPIKTPRPDNISPRLMSGWISSAPARWAADQWGKWDRWDYITCEAFMSNRLWNEAWNQCGFLCACCFILKLQSSDYRPVRDVGIFETRGHEGATFK